MQHAVDGALAGVHALGEGRHRGLVRQVAHLGVQAGHRDAERSETLGVTAYRDDARACPTQAARRRQAARTRRPRDEHEPLCDRGIRSWHP
ncbi:hypothetical protein GCM10025774_37410 [Microbacterium kyungheense]